MPKQVQARLREQRRTYAQQTLFNSVWGGREPMGVSDGHMPKTGCDDAGTDASSSCAHRWVEAGVVGRLGLVQVVWDQLRELVEVHLLGLMNQPVVEDGAQPLGRDLRYALECYARGQVEPLMALPLSAAKTPFAQQVRKALRDIPMGQVKTYGEIALALNRPGAARAVGQACRANPLPLVVPCHRVVASNGLGGFALGLEAKRVLLAHEGFDVAICTGFR